MTTNTATMPERCHEVFRCPNPRCAARLGVRMTFRVRVEGSRIPIHGKIKVSCPHCHMKDITIRPLLDTAEVRTENGR